MNDLFISGHNLKMNYKSVYSSCNESRINYFMKQNECIKPGVKIFFTPGLKISFNQGLLNRQPL